MTWPSFKIISLCILHYFSQWSGLSKVHKDLTRFRVSCVLFCSITSDTNWLKSLPSVRVLKCLSGSLVDFVSLHSVIIPPNIGLIFTVLRKVLEHNPGLIYISLSVHSLLLLGLPHFLLGFIHTHTHIYIYISCSIFCNTKVLSRI
jgi:hypothetical protein